MAAPSAVAVVSAIASTLGGSIGKYVVIAIAAFAAVAGILGGVALRDWHGSIAEAATATCRLADLKAAETARAVLQGRLDGVADQMRAEIERLQADHDRRLAAALAVERAKVSKTCDVDLRQLKRVK
ncbi:MAG: hypothetical protein P4L82_12210 [Ancalomicrobiaceae bacterium]|nr:hypothetical protein [Ancalomicrobiaceae bacterium]